MKRFSKFLGVVLAVVLVAQIAACGQAQRGDAAAPAAPATDNRFAGTPYEKHLDIVWMPHNEYDLPFEGPPSHVTDMLDEMFNVTITVPLVDNLNGEKWAAYFAAGGTADLVYRNGNPAHTTFIPQGIVRTIKWEWLYEWAPDWMDNLIKKVGLSENDIKLGSRFNGEYWMMPMAGATNFQTFIALVRKADLDAAGLNGPPTTLDQYYDLMVKVSDKTNNVYGNHGGVNGNFGFAFAAYDFVDGWVYGEDGKSAYHTRTTDRFKEVLQALAGWYSDGIIDPEYITDDRNIQRTKWTEGNLRVLIDHPWWFDSATNGSVSKLIDEEQVPFGTVQGPYGKNAFARTPNFFSNGFYFGADTSDEKVERIMRIKNELVKDIDLWVSCYWGIEGETYQKNAQGVISYMPHVDNPFIMEWGIRNNFAYVCAEWDRSALAVDPADFKFYELSLAQTVIKPSLMTTDTNTALTERSADVSAIWDTYFIDAVTGRADINATWDAYLADLDSVGYQDIVKGYDEVLIPIN